MPQSFSVLRSMAPMFKKGKWRICRDDLVVIVRGPEKGMTGRVLEVIKDEKVPQVIVEGRNLRKKKIRVGANPKDFFVVTMEAPLHYSQVQISDPTTGKPTRVVYAYNAQGERVRVRKVPNPTEGDVLPEPLEDKHNPRAGLAGPKDTAYEVATKVTYDPTSPFPFTINALEKDWAKKYGVPGSLRAATFAMRGLLGEGEGEQQGQGQGYIRKRLW